MASIRALILCLLLAQAMCSPILRHILFDAPQGVDVNCNGGVTSLATYPDKSVHQCAVRCVFSGSSCSGFNYKSVEEVCELLSGGPCTSTAAVTGGSYYVGQCFQVRSRDQSSDCDWWNRRKRLGLRFKFVAVVVVVVFAGVVFFCCRGLLTPNVSYTRGRHTRTHTHTHAHSHVQPAMFLTLGPPIAQR